METIYVNGEEVKIDGSMIKKMMVDYPKVVYFVSSDGIISEYNILDLERSVNEGHHCLAYLQFAKDMIKQNDDPLSVEIVPLLQEMELLTQKLPVDDQLNRRERIEFDIAQKIRSLLLEHQYFIAEGWLNEFDLKYRFILTPFQNASEVQRESILKLYFDLGLDTYIKTSKVDMDGIVLEKSMVLETIKKK